MTEPQRLLPVTMGALALLLVAKSVHLVGVAYGAADWLPVDAAPAVPVANEVELRPALPVPRGDPSADEAAPIGQGPEGAPFMLAEAAASSPTAPPAPAGAAPSPAAAQPDAGAAAGAAPGPASPAAPPAGGLMAAATQPASSAAPELPSSPEERLLLRDLRKRRAELDVRADALAARESLLASAEKRLAARLDELTALQKRLEALDKARQDRDDADWQGLVRVYAAMKPKDAAGIFNDLDMAVLLPIVDRMPEISMAPILGAMQPARARDVTTGLSRLRARANAVAETIAGAGSAAGPGALSSAAPAALAAPGAGTGPVLIPPPPPPAATPASSQAVPAAGAPK